MSDDSLLQHAIKAALDAGRRILEFYKDDGHQNFKITTKPDHSPVTDADLASDLLIRNYLVRNTGLSVLSEEFYDDKKWHVTPERYWLIDPLDGTKEFIAKTDEFGVNIALIEKATPVIGVIYIPTLDELFYGQLPNQAFKITQQNGKRAISTRSFKDDFTILVSRFHNSARIDNLKKKWPQCRIETVGSSIKFCRLAEGKADIYIRRSDTCTWDTAAGECLVRAAGGEIKTLNLQRLNYLSNKIINPNFIAYGDIKVNPTLFF